VHNLNYPGDCGRKSLTQRNAHTHTHTPTQHKSLRVPLFNQIMARLGGLYFAILLVVCPAVVFSWYCIPIASKTLHEVCLIKFLLLVSFDVVLVSQFNHLRTSLHCLFIWRLCFAFLYLFALQGVVWNTQNCTKGDPAVSPPLLIINSIHVDLSQPDIRVVPAIADPTAQVQNLPAMAKQNANFIAGINGGYFWRVDVDGFWRDNVCRGKVRKEAEQPASDKNVNFGISDGTVKIDDVVYGNNCNCTGYSRPAVLVLDNAESNIQVLHRGENVDNTVHTAIGAGPNLVSLDIETGTAFVDVPKDDDNINKVVFEATTAVGLQQSIVAGADGKTTVAESLIMVTSDGSDGCLPFETYCGILSPDLGSLMKEVFKCTQAMSMDQGGSTTMWIGGENPTRDGIVSCSDNKSPCEGQGARALANGLFIEVLK
jgi:hypothetical protein